MSALELPDEVFIIVTTDVSPIARWNMRLGRIGSAGAAFREQNPQTYDTGRDQWFPWIPNPDYQTFVGFHQHRVTSEMRVEYNAERSRTLSFRDKPSRLACLYAWGSLKDAATAKKKLRGRFGGEIVRCYPTQILRAARCNSALVNLAQRGERLGFFATSEAADSLWRHYWSGSDLSLSLERQDLLNPSGPPETVGTSAEPLWEWLIDGVLEIGEIANAH